MLASKRRKVKFLTVIWGEAYIRRFAMLSLPSFVAPGNVPALAESTDLEVIVLTRHDDVSYFETHRTFNRLRSICAVRFVEIDDLITTGVYGVSLTLAYARAVIACGSEMLNTHFVFMNADFVLADGSLRTLCKHIAAGRSIVLGPSFRATAEAVEPQLEAAVDQSSGVLAIAPRTLATLALPHPHPTTVAKIIKQTACHSIHPNQLFWQVDRGTLLGRYYLIFMLCLKPERIINSVNCFCDYAFIPEMCPSGDEVVMGDSDEFFMLELQSRKQESHLLRVGAINEKKIVRSLNKWTTAEHRRAAQHDVVFRIGNMPPEIEAAKAEAGAFVARLNSQLRRPVPHQEHPYWIRAVHAWKQYRKAQGLTTLPPELADTSPSLVFRSGAWFRSWLWALAYRARRQILGRWPNVTVLHPSWIDLRHLRQTVRSLTPLEGGVLIVRNEPEHVDSLASGLTAHFATIEAVLTGKMSALVTDRDRYTHVLIYLPRKQCRDIQRLVEGCHNLIRSGGACTLFIHYREGEDEDDFTESLDYIQHILSWSRPTVCTFAGGRLKRVGEAVLMRLDRSYTRMGLWALPLTGPLLGAWLLYMLIQNLWLRLFLPTRKTIPNCSSASIRFEPVRHASGGRTSGVNQRMPGGRVVA